MKLSEICCLFIQKMVVANFSVLLCAKHPDWGTVLMEGLGDEDPHFMGKQ